MMEPQPPEIAKRPQAFRQQLRTLPAFRALLRAVESDFYQGLERPAPVLDLGCGDGHFAAAAFDAPLDVGVDPSLSSLREASRWGAHHYLLCAEGGDLPFPSGSFGTVVSNSVLEHIPDVKAVLREVARVLRLGGRFYFSVPGPNFRRFLSVGRFLDRLGLQDMAEGYRRLFDRISRHYYYFTPAQWQELLAGYGLITVRWWPYFSVRALAALEWGHPLGIPSLLCKKLTGRWLIVPQTWNVRLVERLLGPLYDEQPGGPGAYLFFSAQRVKGRGD